MMIEVPSRYSDQLPDDEHKKSPVPTYKPQTAPAGLQIVCGDQGSRTESDTSQILLGEYSGKTA
jgi:hypothetical protein